MEETAESIEAKSDGNWEPEWISHTVFCVFSCDRCGQIYYMTGYTNVVPDHENPAGWDFAISPEFFIPLVRVFDPPEKVPRTIRDLVDAAATVFWADGSSAANRIRAAIEELLTKKKIAKTRLSKNGEKRIKLSLHERIDLYGKKDSEGAEMLKAIKWLGNTGSHEISIPRADVLDGMEILEYALKHIYTKDREQLLKKVRTINKRKGPIRSGDRG